MYNYGIAVPEFFNSLLKNSGRHFRQLLSDVHEGYISPDAINSIVLSKNNKAFAREALPLELLEMKAGFDDDEVLTPEQTKELQDKFADLQLDPDTAAAVKENMHDAEEFDASHINKSLLASAKNDHFDVTIDRILNGIQESDEIPEEDKVGAALAFLYNTALKNPDGDFAAKLKSKRLPEAVKQDKNKPYPYNTFIADYKLDFDDFNTLMDDENIKQRVVTDYIPMSYKSDKDSYTDDKGNIVYQSLFAPSRESLAIFDLFANKFVSDLKAGKEVPYSTLGKYIQDVYNNTLKTMTYSDWLDFLENEWLADQKKYKLGSAADYTDEEWAEKAKSFEIPKPAELTAGKEMLTPEDWLEDEKYGYKDYVIPKPRASQAKKNGRWQHTDSGDESDYEMYQAHLKAYINSDKHARDLAKLKLKLEPIMSRRLADITAQLDSMPVDTKDKELTAQRNKLIRNLNWYVTVLNPNYDNHEVRYTNLAERILRQRIQDLYGIRDRAREFKYDSLSHEDKYNKYGANNLNTAREERDQAVQGSGLFDDETAHKKKKKKTQQPKQKSYVDSLEEGEFNILYDGLEDADEYKTLDDRILKKKKNKEEDEWEEADEKYDYSQLEDEDEERASKKTVTTAEFLAAQANKAQKRTYSNQKKAFELLDKVKSDDIL